MVLLFGWILCLLALAVNLIVAADVARGVKNKGAFVALLVGLSSTSVALAIMAAATIVTVAS